MFHITSRNLQEGFLHYTNLLHRYIGFVIKLIFVNLKNLSQTFPMKKTKGDSYLGKRVKLGDKNSKLCTHILH